jgi:hypothetical protein
MNKEVKKEFEKNATTVCEKNYANIVADREFATTVGRNKNAKNVADRLFTSMGVGNNTAKSVVIYIHISQLKRTPDKPRQIYVQFTIVPVKTVAIAYGVAIPWNRKAYWFAPKTGAYQL